MNVPLILGLLVLVGVWGVAVLVRRRRTRYLVANRTLVIEQSLRRARTKQGGYIESPTDEPHGHLPGGGSTP